jgi:predicted nucleic acid-binding protein
MGLAPPVGLVDTSVYIAGESGRAIDAARMPDTTFTSVVTLAELRSGILSAGDDLTRRRRQSTLDTALGSTVLDIDVDVAGVWADLRAHLATTGRRVRVNDLWIAATAAVHHLPVVTQADDFDVVAGVRGLEVVRV